jgi:PBSX family phage terminase large subunit
MSALPQSLTPIPGIVDYWPRGASADLFRHHEPEVVISGPAGTGKTYGCLWRLHLAALKYPGMRALMVRKTQEDLTASAVVTYRERVLASGSWGVEPFGGSKFKPAAFGYPNGSQILVGGLDKADKVMSRDYDLIYVNEMWEIDEDAQQKLTTRVNRPGKIMPYNQVFGDTNPQGPGHWIYRRCHVAKKTTMLSSVHQDNPVLYDGTGWTDAGRTYLDTLANLSGHLRSRLLEGLWVAADGAVYPNFTRQRNVQTVDTEGWAALIAVDFGLQDPTVILTIRHAGERLHIEHEVYQSGMGATETVDAIERRVIASGADLVVVDPSAAQINKDIGQRLKGTCAVRKGENAIVPGITRVRDRIPFLTIDPSCVHTIEEAESYSYPPGGTRDIPQDKDNHAMDPLRYGVMALSAPKPRLVVG